METSCNIASCSYMWPIDLNPECFSKTINWNIIICSWRAIYKYLENHNWQPKGRRKTKASLKHQLGTRSDIFLSRAILNQSVILPHVKYLQPKRSLPEESPLSDRPARFGFNIVWMLPSVCRIIQHLSVLM